MKKEVVAKATVKAEPVKVAVKEETKVETKSVAKKVEAKEEVKETAKKAPAKKTTATKAPAKKAATKKTTAANDAMNTQVYIQTSYCEIVAKDVIEKSIEAYKNEGNKLKVKDINVYIKPEENAAYYVINEKIAGRVDIF